MGLYVGNTKYKPIVGGVGYKVVRELPYDAEIEYLSSNGTQWLDTGITPDSNTKVQFKFKTAQTARVLILGYHLGNNNTAWSFCNYGNEAYLKRPANVTIHGGTISNNVLYELEIGNFYVKNLSSDLIIVSGSEGSFTGVSTITLNHFSTGNSRNTWYYVKIYDGNKLVRDLIPVRVGTTGYMYDRVSGQLFGNAGTGSFVLGNDKN